MRGARVGARLGEFLLLLRGFRLLLLLLLLVVACAGPAADVAEVLLGDAAGERSLDVLPQAADVARRLAERAQPAGAEQRPPRRLLQIAQLADEAHRQVGVELPIDGGGGVEHLEDSLAEAVGAEVRDAVRVVHLAAVPQRRRLLEFVPIMPPRAARRAAVAAPRAIYGGVSAALRHRRRGLRERGGRL